MVFADRGQPGLHDRRLRHRRGDGREPAEGAGGVQDRRRRGLGRPGRLHVLRRRAASSGRAIINNLVPQWLPALDGVVAKLERGAKVADVGCGHGWSTVLMAQGVPEVAVHRLRLPRRLDRRGAGARRSSTACRQRRASRSARRKDLPGQDFDLSPASTACTTWAIPPGAAAHIRQALKPDGTWMVVEPMAGDRLEDNLNPVGRLYYAASTMICVPTSLAQEVGSGARRPGRREAAARGDPAGGFTHRAPGDARRRST